MKIAILTQPLGHNYGGIMQAYALQKVLRDQGYDVTTINRQRDKRNIIVRVLRRFKPVVYKMLGRNFDKPLSNVEREYIYSNMTSFIDRYINRSEHIDSTEKLKKHYKENGYAITVVGSDQVWRPKYSANIYNFFCDFLEPEHKCISYAASFGVDEWEFTPEQTKKCKQLIKRFDAISVRERSAINLCKDKLGVDAELVLDPTMLISAEQYRELIKEQPVVGEGKILRYILDDNEYKQKITRQISKELNKQVFSVQPKKKLNEVNGTLDDYKYSSVEAWLASFRDADFVVTDSFHGCVFSIIMEKPFIVIPNKERGIARFNTVLSHCNLRYRMIAEGRLNIDKNMFLKNVQVDNLKAHTKSIEFLKVSINGD